MQNLSLFILMIRKLVYLLLLTNLIQIMTIHQSQAAIIVLAEQEKKYAPKNVEGLKEFSLKVSKKKVLLPALPTEYATYMTDARIVFETNKKEQIEDFAIVQWIRGCQYISSWDGHKTTKNLSVYRRHFDQDIVFKHADWQIDTDSYDPIYTSYEQLGRFALLRWNVDPADLNAETATWYAEQPPPHNRLFATDLPGGATVFEKESGVSTAKNVSLEFKTCLFRTQDLPLLTDITGKDVDVSKAIRCHTWDHKFVHDFKKKKWLSPAKIDSVCR